MRGPMCRELTDSYLIRDPGGSLPPPLPPPAAGQKNQGHDSFLRRRPTIATVDSPAATAVLAGPPPPESASATPPPSSPSPPPVYPTRSGRPLVPVPPVWVEPLPVRIRTPPRPNLLDRPVRAHPSRRPEPFRTTRPRQTPPCPSESLRIGLLPAS